MRRLALAAAIILACGGGATTGGANINPQAEPSTGPVHGVANIQSSGVIEIGGRGIRLFGVEGIRGRAIRDFRHYLGRREVVCEPAGNGNDYRCRVGDQDLSRVVLYNGGARAATDASPELKAAEKQARAQRTGIWGGGDDDDDD